MQDTLVAPFPWFGGKSRAGSEIWRALGETANYVEPFCGSLAALLSAPQIHKVETVNDADGFISNFWRSVQNAPDDVAHFADWPVIENDLEARHAWLVARSERLRWSLQDPDFFDPKIAGYWVWGQCNWIGTGWCSGKGPHKHDGATFNGDAGRGIKRQIPHLNNAGRGINRKIPHLGDAGRGINRQIPHLGDAGQGINTITDKSRAEYIQCTMQALSARLRGVRIACGDWTRVVTDSVTTRHGLTGVFLDPPYCEGKMDYSAGGNTGDIAADVWTWATSRGDDPKMRIVVAAYVDGRTVPEGWTVRPWKARKGYATADVNTKREVLYCSPWCAD